ncbi:histidine phosphatase family protein [Kocuria sp.]|uniref:SixA phosphatase family protein n=1 Tax=Kocuria sp. TaxID=1871328 RepID=UPI0028126463|nr:histidine phosphatase family protein [Kocuria sp.]
MSRHDVKKLVLMRHARADHPQGVADHDRPLDPRGAAEAAEAGRRLLERGHVPDMILCSSALRARQTCTWLCSVLGELAPTAKLENSLYAAGDARILAVVNHVPETVESLLVIGHLPGLRDAALRLATPDSDYDAVMALADGCPTAALAAFEVPGPWAALDGADARLVDFSVPRPSSGRR